MAFIQATAAIQAQTKEVLSADNPLPERHIIIDTIRKAAPKLGLKPPVMATLEAMLYCLPPKRDHHMVFASNATLSFRRHGISDRTIRRHVETLIEIGLLIRKDSPNKKRFARKNLTLGKSLKFGFDLAPLFAQLPTLARLAAAATHEKEQIAYVRCQIRAAVSDMLLSDPDDTAALEILKTLRRKLSLDALTSLLETLDNTAHESADTVPQSPVETGPMTDSDSQNVRHHQRSNKEITDKKITKQIDEVKSRPADISISQLTHACPEAVSFALNEIKTPKDVVQHAAVLAPMIGIDAANYKSAQARLGPMGAAVTVWAILQFHQKIRNAGAYFRSITSGKNSASFDPGLLIARLAAKAAPNCNTA